MALHKPKVSVYTHIIHASSWQPDQRVINKLEGTGFTEIHKISGRFQQDVWLLEALLDCYDLQQEMFCFSNFKLYLGLEDILYITGLPIDGKPISGIDVVDSVEECVKFFGQDSCVRGCGKGGHEIIKGMVPLEWLKENFQNVPANIAENSPELVPYVQAYALFLIGAIILPDGSGSCVQLHYLKLLEKLEDIKTYAWGAALLAHLNCGIRLYKLGSPRRRTLKGNSLVLQIFALLRLPPLAKIVNCGIEVALEIPIMVNWTSSLMKLSRNFRQKKSATKYKDLMNGVEESQVKWQPYKGITLPPYLVQQLPTAMCKTILICFNECFAHKPELGCRQLGFVEAQVRSGLKEIPQLKYKKRYAGKGRNWLTEKPTSAYVEFWNSREENFIGCSSHCQYPNQSTPPTTSSSSPTQVSQVAAGPSSTPPAADNGPPSTTPAAVGPSSTPPIVDGFSPDSVEEPMIPLLVSDPADGSSPDSEEHIERSLLPSGVFSRFKRKWFFWAKDTRNQRTCSRES